MLESFCTDDRLTSCTGSGGKLVSCSLPLECCWSSKLRSILTTSVGGLVWVGVLLLLWMSGGVDSAWAVASLLRAWVVGRGAVMPLALGSLVGSGLLQLEPDTVRVPSTISFCTGLAVLRG